jgi:hypothetical protein
MKLGKLQKKWIKFLESSVDPNGKEFGQTTFRLKSNNSYCCLGVCANFVINLDRAFIENNNVLSESQFKKIALRNQVGEMNFFYKKDMEKIKKLKPEIYNKIINLPPTYTDEVKGNKFKISLTQLNDCFQLTFEEIAWMIKTFPEKVFKESL